MLRTWTYTFDNDSVTRVNNSSQDFGNSMRVTSRNDVVKTRYESRFSTNDSNRAKIKNFESE